VLDERNFPMDELVLFGSKRSAGTTYTFRGKQIEVKLLQHNDDFKGVDIAFTSAGAGTSKEFEKTITKYGAVMIDNSSAFRMDADVPLVVPEVNAADALERPRGVIANPQLYNYPDGSCTESHRTAFSYKNRARIYLSGCQRCRCCRYGRVVRTIPSGIGQRACDSREVCLSAGIQPDSADRRVHGKRYTKEMKMYNETRKIMHSDVKVSATCVRVPALRAHSESVWNYFLENNLVGEMGKGKPW